MDALLHKFNESRTTSTFETLQRVTIDQNDKYAKDFSVDQQQNDSFGQYYEYYQTRLRILKDRVRKECLRRWDDDFRLNGKSVVEKKKVLDIQGNQPCWCIGTIYCEMKYKPNVLDEVINDTYGAPDLVKSYTTMDGTDEIMLEDESGRVLLVGDFLQSTPFVTGTVVGLLGMEAGSGTFQVLDICYPHEIPQSSISDLKDDHSIALVSGLNISNTKPENLLRLQLLQELLMGRLQYEKKISNIGKLIICGNSIKPPVANADIGGIMTCLESFSDFLGNTLQTIPISVMPGIDDPSDKSLPQRPFHKALFKEAIKPYFNENNSKLLQLTTNPSRFEFNGVQVLITSGENINDICKYIMPSKSNVDELKSDSIEHRLDLMECTLKWQNIAPTIPDTLWAFPFTDHDPFILNELPHVYIVGNQPDYGSREIELYQKKIKLICLPKFDENSSLITLDLKTLSAQRIDIEV